MRYAMPNHPCEFEIPDDWVIEAKIVGFKPQEQAYRSAASSSLVALRLIAPPSRGRGAPLDWRGFDRARLISILQGINEGVILPPIDLLEVGEIHGYRPPYPYLLREGLHRFYASVIAGFDSVPAVIV